jgi:hypothetical protein
VAEQFAGYICPHKCGALPRQSGGHVSVVHALRCPLYVPEHKDMAGELSAILAPYRDHGGWYSLEQADKHTQWIIDILARHGIRL